MASVTKVVTGLADYIQKYEIEVSLVMEQTKKMNSVLIICSMFTPVFSALDNPSNLNS